MTRRPTDATRGLIATRRSMGDGTLGGRVRIATPHHPTHAPTHTYLPMGTQDEGDPEPWGWWRTDGIHLHLQDQGYGGNTNSQPPDEINVAMMPGGQPGIIDMGYVIDGDDQAPPLGRVMVAMVIGTLSPTTTFGLAQVRWGFPTDWQASIMSIGAFHTLAHPGGDLARSLDLRPGPMVIAGMVGTGIPGAQACLVGYGADGRHTTWRDTGEVDDQEEAGPIMITTQPDVVIGEVVVWDAGRTAPDTFAILDDYADDALGRFT